MTTRLPSVSLARTGNGRLAVAVLTFLSFTVLFLQVGIVPLLPHLGQQLHLGAAEVSWLLTAELLGGAVAIPVLTRLADLHGKRRIIVVALSLVLVGAVLGMVTDSVALLLVGRVLMGAQAPMLALPASLASDTMSPARAQGTIATIHAGNTVGVGGGLLLGGLIGAFDPSFHAYFYVAGVVVALGLIGTLLFVRESNERGHGGFDVPGGALLAVSLVCLLLAISKGPAWGWGSGAVLGLFAAAVVLLGVFWVVERRTRHPLIDVRVLTLPGVWLPNVVVLLIAFGIYGAISAVTRFAQTPPKAGYGFGFSPLQVTLFAIPTALGGLVGAFLLRRLGRRLGFVATTAIAVLGCTVSYLALAAFHTIPVPMMIALAVYAFGNTMGIAAAQVMLLADAPARRSATALTVATVLYAVGNSLGSAIVGVLFAVHPLPGGLPAAHSYVWAFLLSGACVALATGLCTALAVRRSRAAATVTDPAAPPTSG
ncbi:MFS transporter [Amycolatopsis sp. FDAARGOS 1241]|uniref:MFS transporter n=1 Tax=Amycolatopsis sp. FDAARGOS 1241 TaxID=2778070 RepID=UPI0019527D0B|nr:MFS transporter [Amycolatopsis sp. FDAARGOS 1241]QRP49353.1 MFS transporter [Amycolatopsis sp. FDAARGOS 1241]